MTETCVLVKNAHPVSIFSKIHSSKEKHFTSANDVTFSTMKRGADMFGHATFVMGRGYDDNKMFLKLDELKQDYAIWLTSKRNLFSAENRFLPHILETSRKERSKLHIFALIYMLNIYTTHR